MPSLRVRPTIVQGLCAIFVVFALPAPVAGSPDDVDDHFGDLMFNNQGAQILLPDAERRNDNSDWLRFSTGACGELRPDSTRHARLGHSTGLDLNDVDGDDYDGNDYSEALAIISRWLAVHPEIAVVSDGVAKTCDDGSSALDDDYVPPDSIA